MASIEDLLTKAEADPVPFRDVDVWIGEDVTPQVMELEERHREALADMRFGDPRPAELEAEIDAVRAGAEGELSVLRFRKLPATQWAEITARAPMRVDAPVDREYGFNVHLVGRVASSASGVRVDGDNEEPLSPEQWERLLKLLSGFEFDKIVDAIFYLNAYGPEQRILAAKKASRAGTDVKSN